jgi:hypothetical protein
VPTSHSRRVTESLGDRITESLNPRVIMSLPHSATVYRHHDATARHDRRITPQPDYVIARRCGDLNHRVTWTPCNGITAPHRDAVTKSLSAPITALQDRGIAA